MQNHAILAGIRALVEQIDQLERQNAMKATQGVSGTQPQRTVATRHTAASERVGSGQSHSKASAIARRLGVSSRNFYHVVHASGREQHEAN